MAQNLHRPILRGPFHAVTPRGEWIGRVFRDSPAVGYLRSVHVLVVCPAVSAVACVVLSATPADRATPHGDSQIDTKRAA
ncbi:hypothetical protein FRAHR75_240017 [Frankia sp. Hr75.2]|nr:hypothetical protein FRAHR75_240017 [Frankia sp. Hr75.2]